MKKIVLLGATVLSLCLFSACSKDGIGNSSKTYCWKFTIKSVTSIVGATVTGYPQTTTSTTTSCGLTDADANQVVKNSTMISTSTSGGVTVRITYTCVKERLQ